MTGYPHQTPDGKPVTTCLDWSGRDGVRHFGGGQLHPCRNCDRPTILIDGRPQHKACAESEAEAAKEAANQPGAWL
jgi:hypothetical protein